MALSHEWERFIRIHGGEASAQEVFENSMEMLLRAENPGKAVRTNRTKQGLEGIEVHIHQESGIDIYQCMFFIGRMNPFQWLEIFTLFQTVMESNKVKVFRWTLCLPGEIKGEDIPKWDRLKRIGTSQGIDIQLIDGNEIFSRMNKCDLEMGTELVEQFFGGVVEIEAPAKCLTDALPICSKINLIGRDNTVNEVRAMLDQSMCVVLISSMDGVGKTAIMRSVFENILNDGINENRVAWINCGDSFTDDILTLRDALGVPKGYDREDAYDAVLRELKTIQGPSYLFMDGLLRKFGKEELEILIDLRPNVRIMITSKYEIPGVPCIYLKELEKKYVIDMFYDYYKRDKKRKYAADAWRIIDSDSVRSHTLLVELLAKLASQNIFALNMFFKILGKRGGIKTFGPRVNTNNNQTIEESIRKLYNISGLSIEQKRIMSLFTIFTPEQVIYKKVVEWAGFKEKSVDRLVKLGWLSKTDDGYIIHQIVKDSILKNEENNLRIEEYGELLERVTVVQNYISVELEYSKVRDRLILAEDMARHLEARLARILEAEEPNEKYSNLFNILAVLLNNIAVVYMNQRNYDKALEYCNKSVFIRKLVQDADRLDILLTYKNLANIYAYKGDYEKSMEYIDKANIDGTVVLDSDDLSKANKFNKIAIVFYLNGDFGKALKYEEKVLEIYKSVKGKDHLDTAKVYSSLAVLHRLQGEYGKALEYYEMMLPVLATQLSKEHHYYKKTFESAERMKLLIEIGINEDLLMDILENNDIEKEIN